MRSYQIFEAFLLTKRLKILNKTLMNLLPCQLLLKWGLHYWTRGRRSDKWCCCIARMSYDARHWYPVNSYWPHACKCKGAITSKIKHAIIIIKHKTSSARLAQLLQLSLAFCFSLQPKTAYRPVIGYKLKQNANEGCNSCASFAGLVLCFIACFILLVIAP